VSSKSRRRPSKPRGTAAPLTRSFAPLLIVSPLVGLGLGAWLLGSVWPVDPEVETAYIYGGASGLFSGLLGGAAAAGSLVMAPGRMTRWLSLVAGLLFAVGFTGLVLGSMGSDTAPWMLIGIIGIAACVVWFYVLGMVSGYIPPLFVKQYGTWTAPIVGAVLIAVGVATGSTEGLLIGILTVAAWSGILIGSAAMTRRSSEQATR